MHGAHVLHYWLRLLLFIVDAEGQNRTETSVTLHTSAVRRHQGFYGRLCAAPRRVVEIAENLASYQRGKPRKKKRKEKPLPGGKCFPIPHLIFRCSNYTPYRADNKCSVALRNYLGKKKTVMMVVVCRYCVEELMT